MSTGNTEQYDVTLREGRDDLAAPRRRATASRRDVPRAGGRWAGALRPLQESRVLAWVLVGVALLCLLARATQVYRVFVPFTPSAQLDPSVDGTSSGTSAYSAVLSIGQSFSYAPSGGDPTPWAMTALLVLVLAAGGPSTSARAATRAAAADAQERVVTVLAAVGALAGAVTLAVAVWWVATTGGVVSTQVDLEGSSGSYFFVDPVSALVQAGVPAVVSLGLGLTVVGLQRSRLAASGTTVASATSAAPAAPAAPVPAEQPSVEAAASPASPEAVAQSPAPEVTPALQPGVVALDPAAFRRPGAARPGTGFAPDAQVEPDPRTASSGPAEDPYRRPRQSR